MPTGHIRHGVAAIGDPRRPSGPWLALLALLLTICAIGPATAHPHLFVDAQAALTFDAEGRLARIHNTWTFDREYSAWAVQGLDVDHNGHLTREELQPLANDNLKGLADYHFYTSAGEGPSSLDFSPASNGTLDFVDQRLVLNFDIAPTSPYAIRSRLELAVSDPEYYVAITFADASAVKLFNAPSICSYAMEKGRPMPDKLASELYALPPDVTKLPPDLEVALRGVQGGVQINCPGGTAGHGSSVEPPVATVASVSGALSSAPEPAAAPITAPIEGLPTWTWPAILVSVALAGVAVAVGVWRLRR